MRPRSPGWVLAAALVGISFAGPLVGLSKADPLVIAAWRVSFSLVVVAAALIVTGEWRDWRRLSRRDNLFAFGAGAALAVHFWAWNASIHLTSIAASVTLVSLQPAVIVAISALFLGERPSRGQFAGIALAMAGALVIAAPDMGAGPGFSGNRPLLGNLLAFSAAITAGIYYSIGRHLRARLGLWGYVGLVYSACALVLVVLASLNGKPLIPQPERELAIFAALALGPMLLGHTGMNWALKYLPAYVVNLVVLGEPIGATILAAVIPGLSQVPSLATMVGGAIVLAGVAIAARGSRSTSVTHDRAGAEAPG
ncbi:MAG: DMT family transporter [Gemmatimonadaceae bacterium]|nr:DMT family transporter [Gemmatimonadaceae bacterium]